MKIRKTNALRLVEQEQIPYETLSYVVDENDLTALHVARQLGQDPAQVFKTLVLRGDRNGLFVCLIPGNAEVDLKKAARISGNKSAAMLPMKELLPVTGYIRGGCSLFRRPISLYNGSVIFSRSIELPVSKSTFRKFR